MKYIIFTGVLLVAGASSPAMAVCGSPATRVQGGGANSLDQALQNRTVCAALGNDSWHEYHGAGGVLTDIKQGAADPLDPSEVVGSWSVRTVQGGPGNSNPIQTVIYNYGGGGTYEYEVWRQTNGTYDFCGATTVGGAVLSGTSASVPTNSPC